MKKNRAAAALDFIKNHPRCSPDRMSKAIMLNAIDADGFLNPIESPISRLYRAGYVVGWLHGAGLIRIGFWRRLIPRGTALLTITPAGRKFLRDYSNEKAAGHGRQS